MPEQGGTSYQVTKGEAVVVDLGNRGLLFVTQNWEDDARVVFQSLATAANPNGEITLLPCNYPQFLAFKNPTDPNTVEQVKPPQRCSRDPSTGAIVPPQDDIEAK